MINKFLAVKCFNEFDHPQTQPEKLNLYNGLYNGLQHMALMMEYLLSKKKFMKKRKCILWLTLTMIIMASCSTPSIVKDARETTLMFNGSSVQVIKDKDNKLFLSSRSNRTFKEKLGREIIIQDFELPSNGSTSIVNAKMTLSKGEISRFPYKKACEGLIGNANKVLHSLTDDRSKGVLEIQQSDDQIIFTTLDGFVNLGVSFALDYGLTGNLEGQMAFDYFTAGATVRASTEIKLDCK